MITFSHSTILEFTAFNREKNEASVPVFYADWTSVPVPRTSSYADWTNGLDALIGRRFHSPSAKGVALYGERRIIFWAHFLTAL